MSTEQETGKILTTCGKRSWVMDYASYLDGRLVVLRDYIVRYVFTHVTKRSGEDEKDLVECPSKKGCCRTC